MDPNRLKTGGILMLAAGVICIGSSIWSKHRSFLAIGGALMAIGGAFLAKSRQS